MKNSLLIAWIVVGLLESYYITPVSTQCDLNQVDGYCRDKTISLEGDFNVAVTVGIHESNDWRVCDGPVSISGFQAAVAVEWITGILNGELSGENSSYVPGVKLGYSIFDDCGLPARSSSHLINVFHRSSLHELVECTSNCSLKFNGILSITLASSVDALNVSPPDIPMISINEVSRATIKQTGRFLVADDIHLEIRGIISFLVEYSWNLIAVVHTTDSVGTNYQIVLKEELANKHICSLYLPIDGSSGNISSVLSQIISEQNNFVEEETFGVLYLGGTNEAVTFLEEIKTKQAQFKIASKLMVLLPSHVNEGLALNRVMNSLTNHVILISPQRVLSDKFKSYFNDVLALFYRGKANHLVPWISKYVISACSRLAKIECSLNEIKNAFIQEVIVDKTITAMLSFATSLKTMHDTYCEGNPGLCNQLVGNINQTSDFLRRSVVVDTILQSDLGIDNYNLSFGFDGSNIMSTPVYSFTHFKEGFIDTFMNYSREGSTQRSMLVMPSSVCKSEIKCSRCIQQEPLKFGYIPGDVLILGLFSVHQDAYMTSQNEHSLFRCGEFRKGTTAVVTVSAFLQSIKTIRSKTGINYGAIALDDCYNELNISALLTELFTKRRILRDKNTNSEVHFDNVVAVIGALSSRVTQPVADMMTSLHIPMLSYGASAKTLDNRIRYPYFMRTVPSDALQIQGMIKLLSTLNVKYTGALYIDDAYGASGIGGITLEAIQNGICVPEPQSITEDSSTADIKRVLKENKYNGVKVMVMFTIDTVVMKILGDDVLGDDNDVDMASYAPVFISSEGWGTDPKLANKESLGSLIFTTDSSKRVDDSFSEYLRSYSFGNVSENPWLYRFFEEQFRCNLKSSFEKLYDKNCSFGLKLDENKINSLANEQRIVHAELAVHAIGHAYKTHRLCRDGSCFGRNKKSASGWSKAIQGVQIPISDGSLFRPFKEDGNGNLGFTIHNIQKKDNTAFSYIKVGTYNGTLVLQSDKLKFYDSLGRVKKLDIITCPTSKCPDVCITTTQVPDSSPAMEIALGEVQTDTLTIVLGALAGLLFLVVILLSFLVVRSLRCSNLMKDKKEEHLQMNQLSVPRPTHRSNIILEEIYHEPHSIHSSFNDLRIVNKNMAFNMDDGSADNAPPSSSSGIVAGSHSGSTSPESRVVYSDMSQTVLKTSQSNSNSNESLKALTRRVLEPQGNLHSNQNTNDASKMTYLSANDLVIEERDQSSTIESNAVQDGDLEPTKFNFITSDDASPVETQNLSIPPAYAQNPVVQHVSRPVSLPGIQPLHISPRSPNTSILPKSEHLSPKPHVNLYTNDMYLMPISDKLPTYEQHLQQQQVQKEIKVNNGTIHSPSPIIYTNLKDSVTDQVQNGRVPNAISPYKDLSASSRCISLSPSSSFSSPSASMNSLSPVQKEALLNRILQENPSYFLYQCNKPSQSNSSPKSNLTSPVDKFKQQILNVLVDSPEKQYMNSTSELEDGEVMI